MMYEEIIAKMDDFNIGLSNGFGDVNTLINFNNALIAIVELHKPHDKYEGVCGGCWEEESGFSDYPCPTIQAIEKEING